MSDGVKRYKIEFPLSKITAISFESGSSSSSGLIQIDIRQVPQFYIESKNNDGRKWIECRDFTEEKQASVIFRHVLSGPKAAMQKELMNLAEMDSYFKDLIISDLSAGRNTESKEEKVMPVPKQISNTNTMKRKQQDFENFEYLTKAIFRNAIVTQMNWVQAIWLGNRVSYLY